MGLTLRQKTPGSSAARLRWDKRNLGDFFNVYRADALPPAPGFSCWQRKIRAFETIDDGALPETGLLQYLVTAFACGGESTPGSTSAGKERRLDPCP